MPGPTSSLSAPSSSSCSAVSRSTSRPRRRCCASKCARGPSCRWPSACPSSSSTSFSSSRRLRVRPKIPGWARRGISSGAWISFERRVACPWRWMGSRPSSVHTWRRWWLGGPTPAAGPWKVRSSSCRQSRCPTPATSSYRIESRWAHRMATSRDRCGNHEWSAWFGCRSRSSLACLRFHDLGCAEPSATGAAGSSSGSLRSLCLGSRSL